MITDINSEDRLVQATFADYLHETLGWDSVCAQSTETFGPAGTMGRACGLRALPGLFSSWRMCEEVAA